MFRALYTFATHDGIKSLWSGLSASILRQTTYSTARFALYDFFSGKTKQRTGSQKLSGGSVVLCAGLAGGVAGFLGNPAEVVLVRMCADGVKDVKQRYQYSNALNGIIRIAREEGMQTFYKGLIPNVVRSVIMNVSQIAVYVTLAVYITRRISKHTLDIQLRKAVYYPQRHLI